MKTYVGRFRSRQAQSVEDTPDSHAKAPDAPAPYLAAASDDELPDSVFDGTGDTSQDDVWGWDKHSGDVGQDDGSQGSSEGLLRGRQSSEDAEGVEDDCGARMEEEKESSPLEAFDETGSVGDDHCMVESRRRVRRSWDDRPTRSVASGAEASHADAQHIPGLASVLRENDNMEVDAEHSGEQESAVGVLSLETLPTEVQQQGFAVGGVKRDEGDEDVATVPMAMGESLTAGERAGEHDDQPQKASTPASDRSKQDAREALVRRILAGEASDDEVEDDDDDSSKRAVQLQLQLQSPEARGPSSPQQPARASMGDDPPLPQQSPHAESMDVAESSSEAPMDPASPQRSAHAADLYASASEAAADDAAENTKLGSPASSSPQMSAQSRDKGRGRKERRRLVVDADDDSDSGKESLTRKPKNHRTGKAAKLRKGGRKVKGLKVGKGKGHRGRTHRNDVEEAQPDQEGTRAPGSEGMTSHSDASSARSVVNNADPAPSMEKKKRKGRIKKKADAPASPALDLAGLDALPDSVTFPATGEGDLTSLALKELRGSGDLSLFDTDEEEKGDVKEKQATGELTQKKRGGTGDSEYEKSDSEDSVVSSMASGDEEVARQAALTKEDKKLLAQQAIKNEELEDSRKMEEQARVQQQIREAMFKHQQEQSEKSKELQAMLLNKIRARHQATDNTYFQQLTDELRSLIKQTKNEKRVEEGAKPREDSSSDGGESQGGDSGDDDLELEVVPQKAPEVPATAADFHKGSFIESLSCRRKLTAASSSSGVFMVSKVLRANPNDPLAALKNKLHQAARQQSAKWLARELGWKDHVQHQRDLKIKELQRKAVAHRLKTMREQKNAGLDLDGLVPPQEDGELGRISGLDSQSDSDSSMDSVECGVDSDADDEEALAEAAMEGRLEMETAGSDGDVEDNEDDEDVGDGTDAAAMELSSEMLCEDPPLPHANEDTITEAEDHGSVSCVATAFSLGGSGDDTPPTELESMASEESDRLARELSVSRTTSGASQASESRSQSRLGRSSHSSSPAEETAAQLGDAGEPSTNSVLRGGAEMLAEGLTLTKLSTQDESPAPLADGAADSPAQHFTGAPTAVRKLQLADDGSLKAAPLQKGLGAYFAAKAAEDGAACPRSPVVQPPKQPAELKKGTIMAAFQKQADKAAQEQEVADGEEGEAGETETQPLEGDAEAGCDEEEEAGDEEEEEEDEPGPPVDRAAAYKAMLEAERKQIKAQKRMKKLGIADQEAEEEEEEDMVRGLEDFGFGAISGIAGGKEKDAEENEHVKVREDDFENIVDQLSDEEGDEKALEDWARNDELKRDEDHLKEIVRRVKEGQHGRRGRGVGAHGHLEVNELLALDPKRLEEAYRKGLLTREELMEYQLDPEEAARAEEEDYEEQLAKGIGTRHGGLRTESAMLFTSSSDEEEDEDEGATATMDVGKQQEREERAIEKAWVRKAKMRRVLADLEDREAAGLSAPGSSKLPTLFKNANDDDSQHIMGLLQRSASINEVASRKRKEKELEFCADIIDHHSGLDQDSTAQMGFPSKRRAVSNESQSSGSSGTNPPPSNSVQGLFSRIRELKRSSTLTSSGTIMQQGLYRKGSMLTGMKHTSSSSSSSGAMHVAHVASHKFVFTSTAAPTGLNEDSQSRFSGSMPLGTDASMHGGSHSLMGGGQNSHSQSQSCFAPSTSSHAGNGGSRKRANRNTALWKGLSQRRF